MVSGMALLTPFILMALFTLLAGAFFHFSLMADVRCPVCKTAFDDIFTLRRHMKQGLHPRRQETEHRRAA